MILNEIKLRIQTDITCGREYYRSKFNVLLMGHSEKNCKSLAMILASAVQWRYSRLYTRSMSSFYLLQNLGCSNSQTYRSVGSLVFMLKPITFIVLFTVANLGRNSF